MVKKKIKAIQEKRALKKEELKNPNIPRITNDNVAEHRKEVISGARKYIYPLQHSKHRIVLLTTTLVVTAILLFTASTVYLLYRRQTTSSFMYQVSRVVPFPVARIGTDLVSYENYLFELRHYIHYYETQQQLSFESVAGHAQLESYKKRALGDVVDLAYTRIIAQELDVSVTNNEIEAQIRIAREQNRLGSSDDVFEDVLKDYWNWSVADFRRSLANELLIQKVTRSLDGETEIRAAAALAKLESGTSFADVAREYSDDEGTRDGGGEFGQVDAGNRNVSQQTVDTLLKLPEGQYSGITVIPYQNGYALEIVKSIQKKGSGANGAHIIFRLKDLSETLNDRKEQQPYKLYVNLPG